jgi:DNA-binding MarR family transcriptional regulator
VQQDDQHLSDNYPESDAPDMPDTGVEKLAQAADALFYAMRRARTATAGQAAPGLSLAQLALLDPLAEGAELPVGRLAGAADVSVPTATRMLQQLDAKGVVTRRRPPADERQVLVRLTEEGAAQLATVRQRLRERQARSLTRFTPDERTELARQLHRLADIITQPDD